MNGPLSPDELARIQSYYGGADLSSSAATPAPDGPPPPPSAPVAPATPYGKVDLASYFGPAPAPPPPTPEVSTWNPTEQGPADAARFMGKTPPPSVGTPSVASLRAGSAAMNAAQNGGPPVSKPGGTLVGGEGSVTYERAGQIAAEQKKADKDHRPGPAGAGHPDPYGGRAARKDLYGTFPQDQAEVQNQAEADKGKVAALASGNMDMAQQRILDAAKQEDQAHHEAAIYRGYIEDSQRQLDEVRQEKVNPNRLYQDGGSAFAAIIGGVLGGVYQGINKLEKNPFIEDMNRNIERDISLQERELARKTGGIKERQNMLGQLRETYKDENLARTQAKALYYQGAMQALDAEASTYDSPAIQAKANQAKIAMQRQLDGLKIDDASKQAAAAAAGAAAARAARQQEFENSIKLHHEITEDKKADAEIAKSGRAEADKTDEQTSHLGVELSKPELVEAKKTIDDLKKKMINPATGQVDGSKGIPGVGPGADTREAAFPGAAPSLARNFIPGYGAAHYYGKLSPEERVGRMEWDRLALAYKHAVTGAGGSDKEAEGIQTAFSGANTPGEQAAAIRLADAALAERESRIRAGSPREAVRKYDAQLGAEREGRPQPVRREPVR